MDRQRALKELKLRVTSPVVIRHSLAVEAIMRAFAKHFKDDEEKWGLTGLLHDIDSERCEDVSKRHGAISEEILEGLGADDFIIYAIKAHNNNNSLERKRKLDKVLYSADAMATLALVCADELYSGKVEKLTKEVILDKINDQSFCKHENRDHIRVSKNVDVNLDDFVDISVQAIKSFAREINREK